MLTGMGGCTLSRPGSWSMVSDTSTQARPLEVKQHWHHWTLCIDPRTPDVPARVALQCATCPERVAYERPPEELVGGSDE
jgi:hypothetical protein